MLKILDDGPNRFRILDAADRELGWIRGRALRFHGFAAERDAVQAARAAWQALTSTLRSVVRDARPHEPRLDDLTFVHDGAYEWVSDGMFPIARLFRPRDANARDASFAIELIVPSYAPEGAALTSARAITSALSALAHGGRLTQPPLPAA